MTSSSVSSVSSMALTKSTTISGTSSGFGKHPMRWYDFSINSGSQPGWGYSSAKTSSTVAAVAARLSHSCRS